ncbi:extracellular solute-binding protein [Clostridiaceae bacterium NSJ-31]|uniref:Extracellular solute-binding protein n=2 Tax=Ligaoa zhengdingensis TaxID=2763658 RepID=A0A926E1Z1_9FIRM|nr:extracellular solute-binding protein [Ligaoa zhengdingensis]
MLKRWLCAAMAALLVVCSAGCGQKPDDEAEPANAGPSSSESSEEPEEDLLVIYSPLPQEVLEAAVSGFEAETGVEVETVRDSVDQLIGRISAQGDKPQADLLFGGGAEVVRQFEDLFTPYETEESEALDPLFTADDNLYTPLTPMPIVLMYSKEQTTRAPAGWTALVNSAYNGWIAFADPSKSGTSYTALCVMDQSPDTGEDYVERFAENLDGKMCSSIAEVYARLADGTFAAGVTLENSVQKYLEAGYENAVGVSYPQEGTTAAVEVSAVVKGAPHEELAQQFIDYVSGEEFQKKLTGQFELRTARSDLDDPEGLTPRSEIKFIEYSVPAAVDGRAALLERFAAAEKPEDASSASEAQP